jgi:outer membrane protein
MLISKAVFKKSVLTLSVCSALAASQSVMAYEEGDIILKAGAAQVAPNASSHTITVDSPALGDTGVNGVDADKDTQLGLTLTYMLSNRIGLELLAATPFEHDISLGALGANIGSTQHLPPTLSLTYFFNDLNEKFQPYVGAGVNYTTFFDTKAKSALDNDATFSLLASLANGSPINVTGVNSTDIELDDSFGLAFTTGFNYALTENMGISMSYYHIDIDTEAEITTDSDLGKIKASVDVSIDPNVYMVGMFYKF